LFKITNYQCMSAQNSWNFGQANVKLPEPLASRIADAQIAKYQSGQTVLNPGEPCQSAFFVLQGSLRLHRFLSPHKDKTLLIVGPQRFITDVEALQNGTNSQLNITAVEDAEVAVIPAKSDLAQDDLSQIWMAQMMADYTYRLQQSLQSSAARRFEIFHEAEPTLAMVLPEAILAKYLCMTKKQLRQLRLLQP
jgi:CRP-like cAMP-binding protein